MKVTLITKFVNPPIGSRLFDWCAFPEEYELPEDIKTCPICGKETLENIE
jgi:hypothetical protein